jgi:hypothetical protein
MAALRTCTDGVVRGEAAAAVGTAAAVGKSAAEVGSPVSPLGELILRPQPGSYEAIWSPRVSFRMKLD